MLALAIMLGTVLLGGFVLLLAASGVLSVLAGAARAARSHARARARTAR